MNSNEFHSAMNKAISSDNKEEISRLLCERTKTLVEELMKPTNLAEIPCVLASFIVAENMYRNICPIEDKMLAKKIADTLGSNCTVTAIPTKLFNGLTENDGS